MQGKGSALAAKGRRNARQRQCLSREGQKERKAKAVSYVAVSDRSGWVEDGEI